MSIFNNATALLLCLVLSAPITALAVDTERGLKKCRLCHGKALTGKRSVPSIAGLQKRRVLLKLTTDVPRPMEPIVRGLSEEEKRAIADAIAGLAQKKASP